MPLDPASRIPMPLHQEAVPAGASSHVRIVNSNTFTIEDMYDSEPFQFPPNERVTVPYVVAAHIFGLGLPERDQLYHCMKRFGWNMAGGMEEAKKNFKKISISPVFMQLVEVHPPEPEFSPTLPSKRGPGRPPSRAQDPQFAATLPKPPSRLGPSSLEEEDSEDKLA